MRIKSKGTIRLNTTNPMDQPIIDPKYLSVPEDMADMIESIKFVFYMIEATSLRKYVDIYPVPIPGCSYCPNIPVYKCDSYIRCLLKQYGGSASHPSGSCRMSSPDRSDSVVDPNLRVNGIHNLRVNDASIMPLIPNANTNAACIMIGEKGADLIKQTWPN